MAFLLSLVGRRFWLGAWIAMILGWWVPLGADQLTATLPWLLAGILFFGCLGIDAHIDRSTITGLLGRVAVMTILKLVILPLVVWGSFLLMAPQWNAGVLLVWAMPASASTIALAQVLGGNRITALGFVFATHLAAPITIPLVLHAAGVGAAMGMSGLLSQSLFLMAQIVIPFLLARLLRRWQPVAVQAGAVWWGRLAILSMHFLIMAGTACSRPTHPISAPMDLWQPLLCVCLGGAITCGLGLMTRWWWSAADALTFTIGSVFMNYGLALACASRFYPGRSDYLLLAILVTIPAMGWPLVAARLLAPASTKKPAPCT